MPARPKSSAAPTATSGPEAWRELQNAFFARMGGRQTFHQLFDHLPGIHFFAKDREGRFVAVSRGVLERFGVASEAEIIGRTDSDFHPPRTVEEIRADDAWVMSTRQPLIDRVEALFTRSAAKNWYATTKLPIVAPDGAVIGIMGFVRLCHASQLPSPALTRLQPVVAHIHRHHGRPIPSAELARVACVSPRQLHRLFHEVFGMNCETFVVRTRVQAASDDLLLTEKTLGEIALEHGFCDQSAFSRAFREHTGETPLRFRQRRALAQPAPPVRRAAAGPNVR